MGRTGLYSLAFSQTVVAILNSADTDEVTHALDLFKSLLEDPQAEDTSHSDDELMRASNEYWIAAYVVSDYEVTIVRIARLPEPVTNPVRPLDI